MVELNLTIENYLNSDNIIELRTRLRQRTVILPSSNGRMVQFQEPSTNMVCIHGTACDRSSDVWVTRMCTGGGGGRGGKWVQTTMQLTNELEGLINAV